MYRTKSGALFFKCGCDFFLRSCLNTCRHVLRVKLFRILADQSYPPSLLDGRFDIGVRWRKPYFEHVLHLISDNLFEDLKNVKAVYGAFSEFCANKHNEFMEIHPFFMKLTAENDCEYDFGVSMELADIPVGRSGNSEKDRKAAVTKNQYCFRSLIPLYVRLDVFISFRFSALCDNVMPWLHLAAEKFASGDGILFNKLNDFFSGLKSEFDRNEYTGINYCLLLVLSERLYYCVMFRH